ncbi:MAG: TIGR04086 family membrane protein [Lachnospiraceae bacterium]|nr:TIGR04086 family membrane protein [Lachnospiraceae bacterium]
MGKKISKRIILATLFAMLITAMFIFLGALLLYKDMASSVGIGAMVVASYVCACLVSGCFLAGIGFGRRFLWGSLMGSIYFGILFLVGMIFNGYAIKDIKQCALVAVICIFSGMIGGMLKKSF